MINLFYPDFKLFILKNMNKENSILNLGYFLLGLFVLAIIL